MHDSLSCSLTKCIVEIGAVMLSQVVARERLTAVLVDSLEDLEENVSSLPTALTEVRTMRGDQPCSQLHNPNRGTAR